MKTGAIEQNVTTQIDKKSFKESFWINIQIFCLVLTVCGQALAGIDVVFAEVIWLIANVISYIRDYILKRPFADKLRDGVLTLITIFLVCMYGFGIW